MKTVGYKSALGLLDSASLKLVIAKTYRMQTNIDTVMTKVSKKELTLWTMG